MSFIKPLCQHLSQCLVSANRQLMAACLPFLSLSALLLSGLMFSFSVKAYEISANFHQGTELETQGISVSLSDNFSRRSPFYWSLGYARFDELYVEWNDRNLKFPLNSLEAALSYRYQVASRNAFYRNFNLELQVGAAAALTENKFYWPEQDEERLFSEQGDINGFVAVSAIYNFSSNYAIKMGVKHAPESSEFGDISSVLFGVKIRFSTGRGV